MQNRRAGVRHLACTRGHHTRHPCTVVSHVCTVLLIGCSRKFKQPIVFALTERRTQGVARGRVVRRNAMRIHQSMLVALLGTVLRGVAILLVSAPAFADTNGTLTVSTDTSLSETHHGDVVIAADGVTLDCNGHTISGGGLNMGILLDGRTRVTVKNCQRQRVRSRNLPVPGIEQCIFMGNTANSQRLRLRSRVFWREPVRGEHRQSQYVRRLCTRSVQRQRVYRKHGEPQWPERVRDSRRVRQQHVDRQHG